MSILGNFQKDILDKLNKIIWTSEDGDLVGEYTKKYVSKDGDWEVGYTVEPMKSYSNSDVPFRAVIHVRYRGEVVTHWGCTDNQENSKFMIWWLEQQRAINDLIVMNERKARKEGELAWKNL